MLDGDNENDDDILLLTDIVPDGFADDACARFVEDPPFPFERELDELSDVTAELHGRARDVVAHLRGDLDALRADWPTFPQEVIRSGTCIVAAARRAARAASSTSAADAGLASATPG